MECAPYFILPTNLSTGPTETQFSSAFEALPSTHFVLKGHFVPQCVWMNSSALRISKGIWGYIWKKQQCGCGVERKMCSCVNKIR